MRHRYFAAALGVFAILAACNKEPPPKKADETPKATPVPSDMVFNDFLPQGGQAGNLKVRMDGGLEGGLAEVAEEAAGGGGDGGAGGAAEAAPDGKLRVTDPGAEPRATRKYAFVANRVDKRILTMRQQAAGPRGPQEIALAFTVQFTPKDVKPTGTKMEMKILGIDIPGAQGAEKQAAAQQLGVFNGLVGAFDLSPRGEVGELEFKGDDRMQNKMAQLVLQGMQQFAELIVPVWPTAPIGVGAKWESREDRAEGGVRASQARTFTLKELTADGGTVVSDISIEVPKTALPPRPGSPQGTIAMSAKGSYTYNFKFDHVSTRVEGELSTTQNAEIKGQPPISETVKAKHLLEPAK